MRLAQMIRIYCAANSVDQKTLAEQWGAGESTVTRFLASEQMPNGATVARIIAWLFEDCPRRADTRDSTIEKETKP